MAVVIGSFRKAKTYAKAGPLAVDVDCIADGPTGKDYCALRVRIGTGGTLNVVFENNVEETITYASGDVDDIAIKAIKATSTAQQITIYWI
jgi:hypothetical protein